MRLGRSLRVDLGNRGYDIIVGDRLLEACGPLIAPLLHRQRVFVVTDEVVAEHHLQDLQKGLKASGISALTRVVPPGEATKDLEQLGSLVDWLLGEAVERRDLVVALGGGVVGDLAGFAAAVTLRGIDFVQIPTTLLAQVDSSVGGKTGINSRWGKNLIGAFHQPRLVLADTAVLATLPRRQLLAGYAEVVKYGLIGDCAFFSWLESNAAELLAGDEVLMQEAILKSCAAKAAVVAEDEREAGKRALLNLGHTFGHALEAECGYGGELLHGEAVAIGMVMACELSVRLGLCPAEDARRVRRHLEAVGLPTRPPALDGGGWDNERLIAHMSHDKKVSGGKITFVLLRGIGRAFLDNSVATADIRSVLAAA